MTEPKVDERLITGTCPRCPGKLRPLIADSAYLADKCAKCGGSWWHKVPMTLDDAEVIALGHAKRAQESEDARQRAYDLCTKLGCAPDPDRLDMLVEYEAKALEQAKAAHAVLDAEVPRKDGEHVFTLAERCAIIVKDIGEMAVSHDRMLEQHAIALEEARAQSPRFVPNEEQRTFSPLLASCHSAGLSERETLDKLYEQCRCLEIALVQARINAPPAPIVVKPVSVASQAAMRREATTAERDRVKRLRDAVWLGAALDPDERDRVARFDKMLSSGEDGRS